MFIQKNFLLIVLALATVFAFALKATVFQNNSSAASTTQAPAPAKFAKYWFTGKAEVNTYTLAQSESGTLHSGEAILIFATEDFRTDKQVKAQTPEGRDRSIPVMKANISKKFTAGLSDYSLFTSVFTPISIGQSALYSNTLKVSTSGQDWDGHSYIQLNYRNNGYQVSSKSYAENEAEEAYTLEKATLEDELWNRIRLNPDKLPTGEIQLIPGTITARLRHKPLHPLVANAKVGPYQGILYPGKKLRAYTISYPSDDRTLMIVFDDQFPHKIVGWEETYRSKDNLLTSRAVLKKTLITDDWNHNAPTDSMLRAKVVK
ncbi:hypothetical protein GCM10027341_26580 [Spirosoma knui]